MQTARMACVGLVGMIIAGCGRAPLRLSEVESVRTANGSSTVTRLSYTYREDRMLDRVEQTVNGEFYQRVDVDYEEGRPSRLVYEYADGARTEVELIWAAGRLDELKMQNGDARWTKSLVYDEDNGHRVIRTVLERALAADTDLTVTTDYEWSADGALEATETETVYSNNFLNVDVTSTSSMERRYTEGGELDRVNVFQTAGNNTEAAVFEYQYGEGRLAEVTSEAGDKYEFDYDDSGRLGTIEIELGSSSTLVEYRYEEGDIAGPLRLLPQSFPGAEHFDLRGRSFPELELMTLEFLSKAL